MPQTTPITFISQAFAPIPGEDEDTNPGVYGKALATWLSDELASKGYAADDPIPEDFAWCIPVKTETCNIFIACANDEGARNGWMVFAFTDGDFFAMFTGKAAARKAAVAEVNETIYDILAAVGHIEQLER